MNFLAMPWSRDQQHHFKIEESEAQRGEVTYPELVGREQ